MVIDIVETIREIDREVTSSGWRSDMLMLANRAALEIEQLRSKLADAEAMNEKLRDACASQNEEVCQTLGKALGYPWFVDDQKNFPGATEENGVCVGEHVAESIAIEAATKLAAAEARVRDLENRFCQSHRGDVKVSHDCAYCGLYISARAEGSES